jgi:hypothetical protein
VATRGSNTLMVKLFVLAALLSTPAVNGQPQSSGDKSRKSDTSVSSVTREQEPETEKLRSEVDSLRKQKERASVEVVRDWAAVAQSVATILSFLIGGWWVYAKFVRAQEKYPNIEFTADINIVGEQQGVLIVELIAYLENKGKALHRMEELKFDLNSLQPHDPVLPDQRWGGQINFPHQVCEGSSCRRTETSFSSILERKQSTRISPVCLKKPPSSCSTVGLTIRVEANLNTLLRRPSN